MSTRTTIILWSAGSGVLLGLILDVMLVGAWMIAASFLSPLSARSLPRWAVIGGVVALTTIPVIAGLLGYLEGRLKLG